MLITPHALTGAALAKMTNSFSLAIPIALASHYVLDAIPSWDVGFNSNIDIIIILCDFFTASLLVGMAVREESSIKGKWLLTTGALLAIFPDICAQIIYLSALTLNNPLLALHVYIQSSASIHWSLPLQAGISILALMAIRHNSRRSLLPKKGIDS